MALRANKQASSRGAILPYVFVVSVFVLSLSSLVYVILRLPKLKEDEWSHIILPKSLQDAKNIGLVLSRYTDEYHWEVLYAIASVYVFLQTFMIPGSVFFSVLLGYLFPFHVALFVVCLCSAIGASLCFLIASLIGRKFLCRWFPDKISQFQKMTQSYTQVMFIFIFFLRLAPYIPNWSVNIVAPIVDVPLSHFFIGTFFGVIPLSLLVIQTGTTLQNLTNLEGGTTTSVYLLAVFTFVSLLPFIFRDKLRAIVA